MFIEYDDIENEIKKNFSFNSSLILDYLNFGHKLDVLREYNLKEFILNSIDKEIFFNSFEIKKMEEINTIFHLTSFTKDYNKSIIQCQIFSVNLSESYDFTETAVILLKLLQKAFPDFFIIFFYDGENITVGCNKYSVDLWDNVHISCPDNFNDILEDFSSLPHSDQFSDFYNSIYEILLGFETNDFYEDTLNNRKTLKLTEFKEDFSLNFTFGKINTEIDWEFERVINTSHFKGIKDLNWTYRNIESKKISFIETIHNINKEIDENIKNSNKEKIVYENSVSNNINEVIMRELKSINDIDELLKKIKESDIDI